MAHREPAAAADQIREAASSADAANIDQRKAIAVEAVVGFLKAVSADRPIVADNKIGQLRRRLESMREGLVGLEARVVSEALETLDGEK